MIRDIYRSSTEELQSRLNESVWNFEQNYSLLCLAARDEDVGEYREKLLEVLASEDPHERRYAWDGVRLVFEELAGQLEGYDPKNSVESCRSQIKELLESSAG